MGGIKFRIQKLRENSLNQGSGLLILESDL